jgi:hypothetical protein
MVRQMDVDFHLVVFLWHFCLERPGRAGEIPAQRKDRLCTGEIIILNLKNHVY